MLVAPETTNLVSLTRDVVERFKDEARKAGSQLVFHEPEVRNGTETGRIVGRLDRLRVSASHYKFGRQRD